MITNASDSGMGSLREAISLMNTHIAGTPNPSYTFSTGGVARYISVLSNMQIDGLMVLTGSFGPGSLSFILNNTSGLIGNGGLDIQSNVVLCGTNTYIGGTVIRDNYEMRGTTRGIQGNIQGISTLPTRPLVWFYNFDPPFDGAPFDGTFSGVISGTARLRNSLPVSITFDNVNTYTGNTEVTSNGFFVNGVNNAFGISGALYLTPGSFDLNNFNQEFSGLESGGISGSVELGSGTLTINNTNDFTYSRPINGTGSFVKSGAGIQTLSGVSTYTGGTTINAGTLRLNVGANRLAITGNVTINGGTFDLNDQDQTIGSLTGVAGTFVTMAAGNLNTTTAANTTYAGLISGTGSLTKGGTGTLTLSGNNTYSGGTIITGGTISLGASSNVGFTQGPIGTGTLTFNDSGGNNSTLAFGGNHSIANAVTLTTNGIVNTNTNTGTLSGIISGTWSLTKTGSGTLILNGNNTHTGASAGPPNISTVVSNGALQVGHNNALGAAASTATFATGTTFQYGVNGLIVPNDLALTGTVTVDTQAHTGTLSGVISGTGGITKINGGILVLSGGSPNTHTGAGATGGFSTTVSAGTVQLGKASGLGAGPASFATGTTFQYGVNGLIVPNDLALTGTVTVDTQAHTATALGIISGVGASLTKIGSGILTLSGTNTYTGGTFINEGVLEVSADNNLGGAGNITFANVVGTRTLRYGTAGFSSARNITLNGDGIIDTQAHTATLSGAITGTGTLLKTSGGTLIISGANGGASFNTTISDGILRLGLGPDRIPTNQTLTINGTSTFDLNDQNQTLNVLNGAGTSFITLGSGQLTVSSGSYAGVISETGSVVKTSAGTFTLSGANTYTGGTFINQGVLAISANNNLGGLGDITFGTVGASRTLRYGASFDTARDVILTGNGTVDMTLGSVSNWSGEVSGAGSLIKTGNGTLILSGNNTYDGGTIIEQGTLAVSANSNLGGAGNIEFGTTGVSRELRFNDSFVMPRDILLTGEGSISTNPNTVVAEISGQISGSSTLFYYGSGVLTLSGNNTYTGVTFFIDGTISASANNNLGDDASQLQFVGAGNSVLRYDDSYDMVRPIYLGNNGTIDTNNYNSTLSGPITDFGSPQLFKNGNGILTIASDNSGRTWNTTVNGGHLQLSTGNNRLPTTRDVTLNNTGTLILNNIEQTIRQFSGTAVGTQIDLGSTGILTINNNTFTNTHAGTVVGGNDSELVKQGATGTLILNGDSAASFSGTTTVSAGTLQVGHSNALGTGDANFDNNTTLRFGAGPLILANNMYFGGTVTVDDGTFVSTLSGEISGMAGVLNKNNSGTLILNGNNSYAGGTTVTAGIVQVGHNNALGTGAASFATGTTLRFGSPVTLPNDIALTGTVIANTNGNDGGLSGPITGNAAATFTKNGGGILSISGNSSAQGFNTIIDAGTLQLSGGVNRLPTAGNVTINGTSIFDLNDQNQTVEVLTGVAGSSIDLGSGFLSVTTGSYDGVISGSGGLNKEGVDVNTDILTLTGVNTYTGETNVNGGRLILGPNAAIGHNSSSVIIAQDARVVGNNLSTITASASTVLIEGTIGTATATDTMTIAGGAHFTSTAHLNVPVGSSGNAGRIHVMGDVQIDTGGTIEADAVDAPATLYPTTATYNILTWTGNYTGTNFASAVLNVGTPGIAFQRVLDIPGQRIYLSIRSFPGGTFVRTDGSANTPPVLNVVTADADVSAGYVFWQDDDGTCIYDLSNMGPPGYLAKIGDGFVELTGNNTYTGGTQIYQGGLIGTPQSIRGDILNDASLEFRLPLDDSYSSSLSGSGTLRKTGAGTLTLSGDNNPFTGLIQIENGAIDVTHLNGLGDSSPLVFTGPSIALSAGAQLLFSLSHIAPNNIRNNITLSGSATFDDKSNDVELTGIISGAGTFVKKGSGNILLKGANTYGGGTLITDGTLTTDAVGVPDNSRVVVESLGNFQITGNKILSGLEGSGPVSFGSNTLTLDVLADVSYKYTGDITANGGFFIKKGPGQFIIETQSSLDAEISVLEGHLRYKGMLEKGFSVAEDSFLEISGTVGRQSTVSGNISAGPDLDSLDIESHLILNPNATITVVIDPSGQSSMINVMGDVILNGSELGLYVVPKRGAYNDQTQYLVCTSRSISRNIPIRVLSESINLNYSAFIDVNKDIILEVSPVSRDNLSRGSSRGPMFSSSSLPGTNLKDYVNHLKHNESMSGQIANVYFYGQSVSENEKNQIYQNLDPHPYVSFRDTSFNRSIGTSEQILSHQRYLQTMNDLGRRFNSQFIGRASQNNINYEKNIHKSVLRLSAFKATEVMLQEKNNQIGSNYLNKILFVLEEHTRHLENRSKHQSNIVHNMNDHIFQNDLKSSFWIQPYVQDAKKTLKTKKSANPNPNPNLEMTFKESALGLVLGGDYRLNDKWLVGVGLGYSTSTCDWSDFEENSSGNGKTNNISGNLYFSYLKNKISIDTNMSIGHNTYFSQRHIVLPNNQELHPKQSHGAFNSSADVKFGYQFKVNNSLNEFFARVGHMVEKETPFTEQNAQGLEFSFESHTFQMSRFELGFWGNMNIDFDMVSFVPSYKISVFHKVNSDRSQKIYGNFQDYPGSFTSFGLESDKNFIAAGLGLTTIFDSGIEVSGNYSAQVSNGGQSHEFFFKVKFRF